jgi:hypothetical protein
MSSPAPKTNTNNNNKPKHTKKSKSKPHKPQNQNDAVYARRRVLQGQVSRKGTRMLAMRPMTQDDGDYGKKYISYLTKPFDYAESMRVAYLNGMPTAVATFTTKQLITTDTSGAVSVIMLPFIEYPIFRQDSSGAAMVSIWNQWSSFFIAGKSLAGIIDRYRVVSAGLRLRVVDTANNTKGVVTSAVIPADLSNPIGYTTASSTTWSDGTWTAYVPTLSAASIYNNALATSKPASTTIQATWVPDGPDDFAFTAPTAISATSGHTTYLPPPSRSILSCSVLGGSSAMSVEVEAIIHIEYFANTTYAAIVDYGLSNGNFDKTISAVETVKSRNSVSGRIQAMKNRAISAARSTVDNAAQVAKDAAHAAQREIDIAKKLFNDPGLPEDQEATIDKLEAMIAKLRSGDSKTSSK